METSGPGLSGFWIKCIALLTMTIDHVGMVLFPGQMLFRMIGRIAFPLFCFLLAEGARHSSRKGRYLLRLALFAVLSEIPFDLAVSGRVFYWSSQNVFFTLLLGLVLLFLLERESSALLKVMEIAAIAALAECLGTDYGAFGILLILIFYLVPKKGWACILFAATTLFAAFFMDSQPIQAYSLLAVPILLCYNGQRGFKVKYAFYAYYPLHLLILVGLQLWMAGLLM